MRQYLEKGGASSVVLILIAGAGILGYKQVVSNNLLVGIIFACACIEFIRRMDKGIPLLHIAGLVACLQWLVGPAIHYMGGFSVDRYTMYVPEEVYFAFALPGTAAYLLGLFGVGMAVRQRALLADVDRSRFLQIGLLLTLAGIGAGFIGGFLPGALAFLFHLLGQLRYVGALYFLFSTSRWKWLLIGVATWQLFAGSAATGMFHDLIIWVAFFFVYWYAKRPQPLRHKLVFLTAGFVALAGIQIVKQSYRDKIMAGSDTTVPGEVLNLMTGEIDLTDEMWAMAAVRLNQGWIISATMAHVPSREPFADGETIRDALFAALVPRVLAPGKAMAGGQVNFERFTGLSLKKGTSMAISPLGEAYVNFKVEGGIAFMFAFGALFATFYCFCLKWTVRHRDFLFWIPLIFYQAIKAETEVVTVLNQVSKGAIVAFGLYFILHAVVLPLLCPVQRQSAKNRVKRKKTEIDSTIAATVPEQEKNVRPL